MSKQTIRIGEEDIPLDATSVSAWGIEDLSPIVNFKQLQDLSLWHCVGLTDLTPLADLKLTRLNLTGCTGITDLSPLEFIDSLEDLTIMGCPGITDFGPVAWLSGVTVEDIYVLHKARFACLKGLVIQEIWREDIENDTSSSPVAAPSFMTSLWFVTSGGVFQMEHHHSCCETVTLTEIVGDLHDIIGEPVMLAELVYISTYPDDWAFYKIQTHHGDVTLRWTGDADSRYSTDVGFFRYKLPIPPEAVRIA